MNTTERTCVTVLELDLQSETSIVSSTLGNYDCGKVMRVSQVLFLLSVSIFLSEQHNNIPLLY